MTLGQTPEGTSLCGGGVVPVENFKCEARCCCVVGHFVWVAELRGGIAVCDTQQGHVLTRVVVGNTDERVQFKCMVLVYDEIWAGSMTGAVHIFDASARRWKRFVSIHGAEAMAAPITSLFFDNLLVLGGSETGRIVQWNPSTKEQIAVFVAPASVAAVTVAMGFVVSGDRKGAVQLWDASSCNVMYEHRADTSGVSSLLEESTTSTLWAGRHNGTISVYKLCVTPNFAERLVVGDGAVTSMLTVSGKVFVTTHDRVVMVFAATTRQALTRVTAAHDAFIYTAAKVHAAEMARVWTIGNDGVIRVWGMEGYFLPHQSLQSPEACTQASMAERTKHTVMLKNAQLSVSVAESSSRVAELKEEVRRLRDEAHDLRLRLSSCEHTLKEKDAEIALRTARSNELENDIKGLRKDVIGANARVDAAQRESSLLRRDHNNALLDASQARTESSARLFEKTNLEQQLASERTQKLHLEVRVRDREAEIAQLKAENVRLQSSLGKNLLLQSAERDASQKMAAQSAETTRQELDEMRKRNQLLGAILTSMECTIRHKEEEERDMTALLNAFRRKAAGHVTDSHLSALLKLTIVRNSSRFEMYCDEHTKKLLRERCGPFIEFLQLLRSRDPQTYEHLREYLQHPKAGSQSGVVFDQLLAMAQKKGDVSPEDIVTLKRNLPAFLDLVTGADAADGRDGGGGGVRTQTGGGGGGDGTPQQSAAMGVLSSGRASSVSDDDIRTLLQQLKIAGGRFGLMGGKSPLVLGEGNCLKQLSGAFEFVLQTRSDLVERLAVLLRRVVKAHQVVDTLVNNARENLSPTSRRPSGGGGGGVRHLGSVVANILDELHSFVSDLVGTHLTAAEKQRLGLTA